MSSTPTPRLFIHRWRAFGYAFRVTRIALVLMVAAWALLLSAQGRDILVNLAERGALSSQLFFLAVFYWAFSNWYWARALLNVRFADPPLDMATYNFWRKHLPRWLGAMAFLAVGSALAITWLDAPANVRTALFALMVGAPAWGSLFLLLVMYRRDAARWLHTRMAVHEQAGGVRTAVVRSLDVPGLYTGKEDTRSARDLWHAVREFAPAFGLFTAAFGATLFFWAWGWPGTLGTALGAVILFMMWGGSWLPIGSALTWIGDRYGIPVLSLLLVAAFAFSLTNDNHEIRPLADGADPASRKSVTEALNDWRAAHDAAGAAAANRPPFVVVATAGGGIRAAYWTATVLGELSDCIPEFDDHLFAISGVSGGSVGASVYRNVIAAPSQPPVCRNRDSGAQQTGVRACAQEVLEGDFLGPAVAALLYPDILQRFLPGVWFADRAVAMEESWERAYQQVMNSDQLSMSLARLGSLDGRSWPALFLNATWSETGRRIVASNLRMEPQRFPLVVDQLSELGRDLRRSTAAHNSARFPGVSPPGMWKNAAGDIAGHLVDGGYFENYGAETATNVLAVAVAEMATTGTAIKPVVILISSDPGLPSNLTDVRAAKPIKFGSEVRGILSGLLNTRQGRGVEAATRLAQALTSAPRELASFRMCAEDRQAKPPLGWTLSRAARQSIDSYLGAGGAAAACGNELALKQVLAVFGRTQCGP